MRIQHRPSASWLTTLLSVALLVTTGLFTHANATSLKPSHTATPRPVLTDEVPFAATEPITTTPLYKIPKLNLTTVDRLDFVSDAMKRILATPFARKPLELEPANSATAQTAKVITIEKGAKCVTHNSAVATLGTKPVEKSLNANTQTGSLQSDKPHPEHRVIAEIKPTRLINSVVAPQALDEPSGKKVLLPNRKPARIAPQKKLAVAQTNPTATSRSVRRHKRLRKPNYVGKKKLEKAPTIAPIGSNWEDDALFHQ